MIFSEEFPVHTFGSPVWGSTAVPILKPFTEAGSGKGQLIMCTKSNSKVYGFEVAQQGPAWINPCRMFQRVRNYLTRITFKATSPFGPLPIRYVTLSFS